MALSVSTYATMSRDSIRHIAMRSDALRDDARRGDAVRCEARRGGTTMQCGAILCDVMRFHSVRFDAIPFNTTWYEAMQLDVV